MHQNFVHVQKVYWLIFIHKFHGYLMYRISDDHEWTMKKPLLIQQVIMIATCTGGALACVQMWI